MTSRAAGCKVALDISLAAALVATAASAQVDVFNMVGTAP
jgi:hypothetical protein